MLIVIGGTDKYLSENMGRLVHDTGLFAIRTSKLERIIKELKSPERCVILDMSWEELQGPGVLRQLVNIARISGNRVVCICPNQEEDLKKLSKASRADKVFIRYDLETTFKDYLKEI